MVKPRRPSSRLRVVSDRQGGLGDVTVMDRALAEQHGVPYVHLAVFAIDVDRVRSLLEGAPEALLPFGWEVFMTEAYILDHFDADDPEHASLLEDACLSVLDEAPGAARLGEQIPFAIYDAVERGALPDHLRGIFHRWRQKPKGLVKDLERLWREADAQLRHCAQACLDAPLDPPAAPPTREVWERMVRGSADSPA